MDGVDLLTLGLQEVRSRIAAIPQVRCQCSTSAASCHLSRIAVISRELLLAVSTRFQLPC